MSENVELATFDLRYEGYRMRDDAREAHLLASIVERGIEQPLQGVDTPQRRFLLDGFKRYRSAGGWASVASPTSVWAKRKRWESSP